VPGPRPATGHDEMPSVSTPVLPPLRFPSWRRSTYVNAGHRLVEGWLDPFDARVIDALLRSQEAQGLCGSVGEIGVHHGKLFLLPYLASRQGEAAFAVDVFDQQGRNVDASGRGDERVFRSNLQRHAGSTEGLEVFVGDSLELSSEDVIGRCGRVRFLSIDGGHTERCTVNDLRLAEEMLVGGGLALVDDCFNPAWPDVSSGVATYLLGGGRLRPFLVTRNKVAFSHEGAEAAYVEHLRRHVGAFFDKSSRLHGNPVEVLGTRYRSTARYQARSFVRSRPALKAVAKRVLGR
jgi:hypothetical protein